MKPPASGPSIGPIRPGMATKLIARTSSDFGKVRTSVRRPTGTIIAPAAALQDAERHQQVDVACQAAQERAEREERRWRSRTRAACRSGPPSSR